MRRRTHRITVPLTSWDAKKWIMQKTAAKKNKNISEKLCGIYASKTEGWSGAEVESLVKYAVVYITITGEDSILESHLKMAYKQVSSSHIGALSGKKAKKHLKGIITGAEFAVGAGLIYGTGRGLKYLWEHQLTVEQIAALIEHPGILLKGAGNVIINHPVPLGLLSVVIAVEKNLIKTGKGKMYDAAANGAFGAGTFATITLAGICMVNPNLWAAIQLKGAVVIVFTSAFGGSVTGVCYKWTKGKVQGYFRD